MTLPTPLKQNGSSLPKTIYAANSQMVVSAGFAHPITTVTSLKSASPRARSSSLTILSLFADDSVTQIVDIRIIAPSINTRFYPARQGCSLVRRPLPGKNLHGRWLKGIGRKIPGRSHCTDGIHSIFGKAFVPFNPRCKKKATVGTKILELQPAIQQTLCQPVGNRACRHLRVGPPVEGIVRAGNALVLNPETERLGERAFRTPSRQATSSVRRLSIRYQSGIRLTMVSLIKR